MRPLPKMRSAVLGFTLIEIVMVLVLLGILSAVAVPKYFDLQEEAQAKACQHNRGVVLSAIHTQMAAAKIADDSQLFNDSSVDKATESAQKVLKDFAAKQPPLCPSGGKFSAAAVETSDGNYEYHVFCDKHAPASDAPNGGTGNTVISRDEANVFLKWLQDNFLLPEDQKWTNDHYKDKGYDCSDLSHFFGTTGSGTEIDSGAAINPQSMAATVANAIKNRGLDTDNIIWRLEKAPGSWSSCKGTDCTMLVTIANKSDTVGKNNGDPISVSQYKLKFTYNADGTITTKESKTSTTTAKLEKKVNTQLDKNSFYWALKTKQ